MKLKLQVLRPPTDTKIFALSRCRVMNEETGELLDGVCSLDLDISNSEIHILNIGIIAPKIEVVDSFV